MHLDALVHFPEPLAGQLNRFLRRRVNARLQVAASRQINHEFPSQSYVQRMEQARSAPLRVQVLRCGSHVLTIQFVTSWVKRAATAVRPPVYCSATTETSVSSVPSEFCTRNMSANSRGKVETKSTSRDVPNSITVLSVNASPSPATRVRRIGMRTGLAAGKNLANLAVELSRGERARPAASFVGTKIPRVPRIDATWVPGPAG